MTNLNNYTLLKLRSGHRFDVVFSCIPSFSRSACKEILSPALGVTSFRTKKCDGVYVIELSDMVVV